MPYDRFEQLDEKKRLNILETALDAFIENSFKSASINKISKKAGLSAGMLYYYFENKEDLFYTTLDYAVKVLWNHVGDIKTLFQEYGYWEGITEIVLKRFELSISHPKYMKLFYRVLLSEDEVELEGRSRFLAPFYEIFEYGYTNGYIRNDLPKDLLFDMHFNMTITVNKWTLREQFDTSKETLDSWNLRELSVKTVNMIRLAMSNEEL